MIIKLTKSDTNTIQTFSTPVHAIIGITKGKGFAGPN